MINVGRIAMVSGVGALGAFGGVTYSANSYPKQQTDQQIIINLEALEKNEDISTTISCSQEVDQLYLSHQLLVLSNRLKNSLQISAERHPSASLGLKNAISRTQFGDLMANLGIVDKTVVNDYFQSINKKESPNYEKITSSLCSPEFVFDACNQDEEGLVSRQSFNKSVSGLVQSFISSNNEKFKTTDKNTQDALSESLTWDLFKNIGKDAKISRQEFQMFLKDDNGALSNVVHDFNDKAQSVLL